MDSHGDRVSPLYGIPDGILGNALGIHWEQESLGWKTRPLPSLLVKLLAWCGRGGGRIVFSIDNMRREGGCGPGKELHWHKCFLIRPGDVG